MLARSPAVDTALALIPSIRSCSFDIFDTFVLRECTAPDGVYERACDLLNARSGRAMHVESFVQHRQLAEAKARRNAAETRASPEVSIEDIYALFPVGLFGFRDNDIPSLIAGEFDAELSLCRVNPEMVTLLEAMRQAGVRTGFISDTYWNAEQITRLLRSCRPELDWDFLFVSSQFSTGKAERLFAHYLADCQVDPSTALHIGDNALADIKGAERAKIRALHYPQATQLLHFAFQGDELAFSMLGHQGRRSSRLDGGLRTLRRMAAKQSTHQTAASEFGQQALGPIMTAFDTFVSDRVRRLRQDAHGNVALAFLGRDGSLSFKLWQQLHDETAHYVEINRRVSLIAAANNVVPCATCSTISR